INPYQVHLVNKRGRIYNRVWPPLALANCAALLEQQGHKVQIMDANALRLFPDKMAESLLNFDKVFISSSSLDRWQCPNLDIEPFLKTVASVHKFTDDVFILGVHGTVKPNELLDLTKAKAVIRGEPELTVTEICQKKQLPDIRGLAFKQNGKMIVTQDQKPLDLSRLPMPAFHLLPMDKYHYEVLGSNFTLFEASRGCASKCIFCLLKMYGRGVRKKPLQNLISEIDYAISNFGVKTAYFIDLEFTVFRNQILELSDYLIKNKYDFQWTCQTRFDLVDEILLMKMKQAGCRLIHFGVEAGTDQLLRSVNKKITIKQIEDGMRMVHRAKIESACFFILGFPNSNKHEIEETISFAKRLNPTYALFHIAIPYPGTTLYDQLHINEGDLSSDHLFPEACKQGNDLKQLKKAARQAYTGYYLRPRYIVSRLSRGDFQSLFRQIKLFLGYL
ncbi:MAG: radical SAM protein, partial [Thermodesulfobacteriota bacterium]|nr:radical SAM protein [Thermodesulfobacteriota bacterium]